jgi:amino acid adenylation domain-containing protein
LTDAARSSRVGELITRRRAAAKDQLSRSTATGPPPLSSVQLSLWTIAALASGEGSTNRPTAARLRGPLDHEALRLALEQLVERHEPLRTVYPLIGEEPVQKLVDDVQVELAVDDLSALDSQGRQEAIDAVMTAAMRRDLDPTTDVQFDARLLVESGDSHVLVVCLNHISFDGWSETIFQAELLELYRAIVDGDEPHLPELPISFSDYARWERTEATREGFDADAAYWKAALSGLGVAPSLPAAPDAGDGDGTVQLAFGADEIAAVREVARDEKTTPFVVLLAGLELLGRELLDAEDFAISCPVAGRDRIEVHDLIGCFINPLTIRSSFDGPSTHLDHLRAVRATVAEALAHRRIPNRLVAEQFGRWTRRPNLSRIHFQWRDFPSRARSDSTPIDLEPLRVPDPSRSLSIYVTPNDEGADIEIEYDRARIGRATAELWCDRWRFHVAALCADPGRSLEPLQPVRTSPDPEMPLVAPEIERVAMSIERNVEIEPEAIAVSAPDDQVTYAELWERSGAVAAVLIDLGAEPGDAVAVLTNRNIGHVVAMLGVLRAGAIVVPLDAQLPAKRLSLMATTAGAVHAIVVDRSGELTDSGVDGLVELDRHGRLRETGHAPIQGTGREPLDDRASVFFTSGTTGTPKGVLGTHQGLSQFVRWERARLGVRPGDRIAGITGPSFDVSLREIFLPLTAGATLVVAPEVLLPNHGMEWLARSRTTVVHITPSLARAWMSEADATGEHSTVHWTVFAGETLTDTVVTDWRALNPATMRVMNLYGATETCMAKSAFEVGPIPSQGVQPVGHPLPSSQLLVMAPDEVKLCDPGQHGEVVIRTAIGTQGYLHDVIGGFGENPFAPGSGERVYRTGDLGWYDENWCVTVQGRIDDQVKIDGIRVEPDETASLLGLHPAVRQCAVLAVHDHGEVRLEAFVVPNGEPPSVPDLRRHLHEWIRTAAIPSAFHFVDEIPLTTSHKTDRRMLLEQIDPPAHTANLSETAAPEAADGEAETTRESVGVTVFEAWQQVLEVDELGRESDFFAAGGTSLRALRILARLEANTGVTAPIDLFFDEPTLRGFTEAFARLCGVSATNEHDRADVDAAGSAAPLSFMQETMWLEGWAHPEALAYHVTRVHDLRGPLDTGALTAAIAAIEERHNVLRTTVHFEAGEPTAVISPPGAIALSHVDLTGIPVEERVAACQRHVEESRRTPYDLEAGPLARFVLFRIGEDHHRLLIAMHHLVTDGWSSRLLAEEMGELYKAALHGRDAELPDLAAQYADYAHRQRERNQAGGFDAGLAHWAQALAEPLPVFSVGGRQRPRTSVPAAEFFLPIDPELPASLALLAGKLRATPFMVGLSMWAAFLTAKTQQPDVVIGVPIADRSWAPTSNLIGVFLNTLPLRIKVSDVDSLTTLVPRTRAVTIDAFAHAEVPLARIEEVAAPERRRRRIPLTQVLFQYHHGESVLVSDLDLEGIEVTQIDRTSTGAPVDLSLSLHHSDERSRVTLHYDPRLFTAAEVEALAEEFVEFVSSAVNDPERELPEVSPFAGLHEPYEVPMSYAQERMWFIEHLEPDTTQYLMRRVSRLHGALDVEALSGALTAVVERHHVLRSRIASDGGRPRLFIDPATPLPVAEHDLRGLADADLAERVDELITDYTDTPLDLSEGQLVRALLVRESDDDWVLALGFHHIVMDGLSLRILLEELSRVYGSLVDGTSPELEPLEIQYSDFAAHQREIAARGGYERQLDHWETTLQPPLALTGLGRPRPGGDPHLAVSVRGPLPSGFRQELKEAASQLRATPFIVGLALWKICLSEESQSDDVLVTTVMADRRWRPTEALIGYFVNTLPLPLRVTPGASFREVVAAVRAASVEAYEYGDVPLDLIIDRVRPDRSLGSLVNGAEFSLLGMDSADAGLVLPDVSERLYLTERASAKFDLSMTVALGESRPRLHLRGRQSLFAQGDVERIARRFAMIAEICLGDVDTSLHDLDVRVREPVPIVSSAAESFPATKSVPEQVAAAFASQPDRVAIEADGRSWTASEIDDLASGIAVALHDYGVREGDRVILAAARRSPLVIAAMYGVWKVGAAYVPVDLAASPVRAQAIADDCRPSAILTDEPALAPTGAHLVHLRPDLADRAPTAELQPWSEGNTNPEQAAYVIYTSGSTGRPKGVVVPHRALASFIESAIPAYGISSSDRVLHFHSYAFDASVEEIHLALVVGATIVVRDEEMLGSARRFLAFVERHRVTVVPVPTAFWHELTSQIVESDLGVPPTVQLVLIGGELARADLVAAWHRHGIDARLINSYGPTETTVAVFSAVLTPDENEERVPIGLPLASVDAEIVDTHDRPVVIGEWGELVVAGPQLAIGYLGRTEATEEVFVTRADGRRWYRTGDRARAHADGQVEVSGRFDDQVKIDGHRIEPAEIEHVLRLHSRAADAVVLPIAGDTGQVELHAFVAGPPTLDMTQVRQVVEHELPAPMVPAHMHRVDTIPIGVGGKVDRDALRSSAAPGQPPDVAPIAGSVATTVERLAGLWRDLLQVEHLDTSSNFFDSGGRSLTAIRLAYLIENEFGASLPIVAIFDAPTIGEMASTIDDVTGSSADIDPVV